MTKKSKLIAIVGPTASGKTSLSLFLAEKYKGEIVSADSCQIYRGMNIGTAKSGQMANGKWQLPTDIKHYLVDIKNPDESYTVAEFKQDAEIVIDNILARRKLPMIVGGTGLYVKAVLENLAIPEVTSDQILRARIEKGIKEKGLDAVFQELVELDPEAAYIVDPKNPRRIVRALEVAISTGEPFTAQRKKNDPLYDALKIGINPPPEKLRERIDLRIDIMMQDGLVDEVERLIKQYGETCAAFDAIGYREIVGYLRDATSLEQAVADMKMNTWHYAKRQMTWFKRDKEIHWIQNANEAEKLAEEFLEGGR